MNDEGINFYNLFENYITQTVLCISSIRIFKLKMFVLAITFFCFKFLCFLMQIISWLNVYVYLKTTLQYGFSGKEYL